MSSDNNSLVANDGTFVVFVDELDGDVCNHLYEVNRLVTVAFSNGAMRVVVKRWVPDLPKLKPKNEDGAVFISPE